jgi:hypothetical protein
MANQVGGKLKIYWPFILEFDSAVAYYKSEMLHQLKVDALKQSRWFVKVRYRRGYSVDDFAQNCETLVMEAFCFKIPKIVKNYYEKTISENKAVPAKAVS